MIGIPERPSNGRVHRHPSAVPPTRARHVVTVFAVTLAIIISAAIYLMGGLCWLFLDTQTPLEGPVTARRAA